MSHTLEYAIIAVYLVFMLVMGAAFHSMNRNVSDYFRSGCQGTWWLVGTSIFMSGISAITFTSNAGVAYAAGLSYLVIYAGTVAGLVLNWLFLAGWFRQLRAITFPEVVRQRYGPATQQIYAYVGLVMFLLGASMQLWALALFSGAMFGLDIITVILLLGLVVTVYAATGGSWAMMATEFVQGLILVPVTVLVAILCLTKVGGIGGLLSLVSQQGLEANFALFKGGSTFPGGNYAAMWIVAMLVFQIKTQCSLSSAARYFTVKDGREASKAALLAAILMGVCMIFWVIPPLCARLLYAAEVAALPLANPGEGSYAVISMRLLPYGMTGLIAVAMFSATMSSMDAGINRNAAMVVRDVIPALLRLGGKAPMSDTRQLVIGKITSLAFGFAIVALACYFAVASGKGIFDVAFRIGAMLGGPMSIPLILGLFVRRAPWWSGLVAAGAGFVPSLIELGGTVIFHRESWSWPALTLVIMGVSALAYVATIPFWKYSRPEYRRQIDVFFQRMHQPVDFEKEVGKGNDAMQLRMIGFFATAIGAFMSLLALLPNPVSDRLLILAIAGFVCLVGVFMLVQSRRKFRAMREPSTQSELVSK